MKSVTTDSPAATQGLGRELGRLSQPGDVYLLVGNLGSGKTCLTQGIAWGLDIDGYATSPTFVIVNQYRGRLPLYHIDLYRIDSLAAALDLGLDDYLYGDGVCVVEWADRAVDALPAEHLLIQIAYAGDSSRHLEFRPRGERYKKLLSELTGTKTWN